VKEDSVCRSTLESMINKYQKQCGSETSFTAKQVVKISGKLQNASNMYCFLRRCTDFDHFLSEMRSSKLQCKVNGTLYTPEEDIPNLLLN
jgi:uncharacterized protein YbaR (Trm112 family)